MNLASEFYNEGMKELRLKVNNCRYSSLEKSVSPELFNRADKLAEELIKKNGLDYFGIKSQLRPILLLLDFDLKDKVILDLGCGSSINNNGGFEGYGPFLCKALYKLGARPIGIDKSPSGKEEFEVYQRDLFRCSMNFLPSQSIDLANATGFFDSARENYIQIYFSFGQDSPEFIFRRELVERRTSSKEFFEWKMNDNLFPELERVMKPGRFLIYNYVGV